MLLQVNSVDCSHSTPTGAISSGTDHFAIVTLHLPTPSCNACSLFVTSLQVSSVDCSRSTPTRAISSGTDRCIKVWDLHKGFCTRTIICHSSCNSVRCTRDEHIICSGHFDGTLRFWDLRSGKMANEVTGLHTQQICSVQIGTKSGQTCCCWLTPSVCLLGHLCCASCAREQLLLEPWRQHVDASVVHTLCRSAFYLPFALHYTPSGHKH